MIINNMFSLPFIILPPPPCVYYYPSCFNHEQLLSLVCCCFYYFFFLFFELVWFVRHFLFLQKLYCKYTCATYLTHSHTHAHTRTRTHAHALRAACTTHRALDFTHNTEHATIIQPFHTYAIATLNTNTHTRNTQHTYNPFTHAMCNAQLNTQHATYNTQHATRTRNTQQTTHNTQHTSRNNAHEYTNEYAARCLPYCALAVPHLLMRA